MKFSVEQHVSKSDVVAVIDRASLEQEMYLQAEEAQDASCHEDFHLRTSQLASKKEQFRHEAEVVS